MRNLPRHIAIWDPKALDDPLGAKLARAIADPGFGYDSVQLRLPADFDLDLAKDLASSLRRAGIFWWLNRDYSWISQLKPDGWHTGIGQIETFPKLPVMVAVHNVQDARQAVQAGATACMFGHIHLTPSKQDLAPRGWAAFADCVDAAQGTPLFAVGGVSAADLETVIQYGGYGVASIRDAFGQYDS